MAKHRGTVDTETGEFKQDSPLIAPDLRVLERKIADAYGDFQEKTEAAAEANAAKKESQEFLNALIADLARIVNGEQPLPLK